MAEKAFTQSDLEQIIAETRRKYGALTGDSEGHDLTLEEARQVFEVGKVLARVPPLVLAGSLAAVLVRTFKGHALELAQRMADVHQEDRREAPR